MTTLVIDGQPVAELNALEFDQDYRDVEIVSFRRTADNTGILRALGDAKLATVISGKGWMPQPLSGLSKGSTHVIGCAMPRGAESASNVVSLPVARRSDAGHEPYAFAVVAGELVETTITGIVADEATCATVSGASGYVVYYFPEITAAITRVESTSRSSAEHSWSISAEEF